MIIGLAFIPIENIHEAIEHLTDALPDELQPLLDWFEDNYGGRRLRRGNGRRSPLFPVGMWNIYERTLNNDDKTDNNAEAVYRQRQCELDVEHLVIWKYIKSLRKVQRGRDLYYEHLIAGHDSLLKLKKQMLEYKHS
ncbi:hypothetical protein chiPu_0030173 [Chiloscyllium punctatum]|uniref:Uncharacterized protein n=1 Tax=Chiloscyllium punctatum TaxID=137246 RepID=A0A401TT53_CHIPU|nr:hypothetical protein [Chiloscyllium punctatum]